jgi:hypothetical protein
MGGPGKSAGGQADVSASDAPADPPRLSVVVPVFNEQEWIGRSLKALRAALDNACWPAQVVVVDDGSTDDTPARLATLAGPLGLTVVRQNNQGRFAARCTGLDAARGDQVLLLDSRVVVSPDAVSYLREQLTAHHGRRVWNGHIDVAPDNGRYGAFWAGLVAVAWRRYFANPRFVSFGAAEFDAFPKGTGFFSAPLPLLRAAVGAFSSLFADARFASDDTRMLRWIAEREAIHLSPHFRATYHSRGSLKKFVRHARFRGTTFVDGYLDAPGPVRRAAAVGAAAGVAGLGLVARQPRAGLVLVMAASAGAGLVVRRCGGSPAQARAVAELLPLFAACFGCGVLRGLAMAVPASVRSGLARR